MTRSDPSGRTRSLRVSLDVNIWVTYLEALQHGRRGTATMELVHFVRDMRAGTLDIQLAISTEMLGTLERVLDAKGYSTKVVADLIESIESLARLGPEGGHPHLLLAGRDQLAMDDREDAGVLASAISVRADLLVTDNLKHFGTNDSEALNTKRVRYPDDVERQLYTIIHERADGVALVVAHPFDTLDWLRAGVWPTPTWIRERYADRPAPIG